MELQYLIILVQVYFSSAEIRSSKLLNKLSNVRPVGPDLMQSFVPVTEFPTPQKYHKHKLSGRRHLEEDCSERPQPKEVEDGPDVAIVDEYYDEREAKTAATVIIPDHIDRLHFHVTTQVPYLTVGPIDGLGYHPSTMKSPYPSECEKIYQDHLDEQYTEESKDYSDESLEMARMPLLPESSKFEGLPQYYVDR